MKRRKGINLFSLKQECTAVEAKDAHQGNI